MVTATGILVVGGTGVLAFDAGLTLNWIQGTEDAFVEQTVGNEVSAAGTSLVLLGTGIVLFGVLTAL